jgi:hypothetical protein
MKPPRRILAHPLRPENLFCARTFRNILSHIAKGALLSADVKLSPKVVCIDSNPGGVGLPADDGRLFNLDEVVVTTSREYNHGVSRLGFRSLQYP